MGKVGGTPYAVTMAGVGSVPAGAKAVLVNVTAVGPDGDGFITVHQCGAVPGSSNLNFRVGQTLANLAVTALDGAGRACFTSSAKTDLIVDVVAWLGATGLRFAATAPQRLVDTRVGHRRRARPGGRQRRHRLPGAERRPAGHRHRGGHRGARLHDGIPLRRRGRTPRT